MRDQARAAVLQVPGVNGVDIRMSARVREAVGGDSTRAPIAGVKNVIAVGAGKGGVGKTTVAVNLALALVKCGGRVGVIDADIYGPNVPIMLGMKTQLTTDGKKIVPAEKFGLQVISMGFLTGDDAPIIWRGPMLHGALQQFFREVAWRDLDYLVVDMPPGTGDVALTLSQTVPVAGSIVVTTPQQVSLADSRRAVAMYKKLNIPPLGILENMSHFVCPTALTRPTSSATAAVSGWRRNWACRSSAGSRSTSRFGKAATPVCRSSSASRTRRRPGRSWRRRSGWPRRFLSRVTIEPRRFR